ncbi:MAG: hypothetical protein C5B58_08335 [Acidobacteria bacterium]|nr:MAG: hypothetical protein C5B58_08335 [Acidobacteriota bacterium]
MDWPSFRGFSAPNSNWIEHTDDLAVFRPEGLSIRHCAYLYRDIRGLGWKPPELKTKGCLSKDSLRCHVFCNYSYYHMNKPSVGDAHEVRTTDGVDALDDIFKCDRRLDGSLSVRGLNCLGWLRTMQLCAYLLAILFLFSLARADEPKLVIVDNDFTGPPDTLSDLRSALMFLENPNFKVLGFTVVTGDGWRNEEVAHLLRLEEIVSRCDVPVIPGAVTPLVNTPQDKQAWEKRYPEKKKKNFYWGAWDTKEDRPWELEYTPHDANVVPPIPEGLPCVCPSEELAPDFMIRQVHAHPHEISIFAGGPLTDLNLAVRMDPEFASLVKELVFLGAAIPPADPDFNTRFDPEAAKDCSGGPLAKHHCNLRNNL